MRSRQLPRPERLNLIPVPKVRNLLFCPGIFFAVTGIADTVSRPGGGLKEKQLLCLSQISEKNRRFESHDDVMKIMKAESFAEEDKKVPLNLKIFGDDVDAEEMLREEGNGLVLTLW